MRYKYLYMNKIFSVFGLLIEELKHMRSVLSMFSLNSRTRLKPVKVPPLENPILNVFFDAVFGSKTF